MLFRTAALAMAGAATALASGHGPTFGLATPTAPKGGFSLDLSGMARNTSGSMIRATLGYGLTPNLKLQISGPLVIRSEALVPARVGAFTPMPGDGEAIGIWRFQRKDLGVGSRFESAVLGGVSFAPDRPARGLIGGVTGYASRTHYAWAGAIRQPGMTTGTFVYGWRPQSWRTDYPRWDWRLFAELTGETFRDSGQVFLGPSTLGVWKNWGVSGGVQFPIHQSVNRRYPKEKVRYAINLAYFF